MTKMMAMPIYDKDPLKIFSRTRRPVTFGLDSTEVNSSPGQCFDNFLTSPLKSTNNPRSHS